MANSNNAIQRYQNADISFNNDINDLKTYSGITGWYNSLKINKALKRRKETLEQIHENLIRQEQINSIMYVPDDVKNQRILDEALTNNKIRVDNAETMMRISKYGDDARLRKAEVDKEIALYKNEVNKAIALTWEIIDKQEFNRRRNDLFVESVQQMDDPEMRAIYYTTDPQEKEIHFRIYQENLSRKLKLLELDHNQNEALLKQEAQILRRQAERDIKYKEDKEDIIRGHELYQTEYTKKMSTVKSIRAQRDNDINEVMNNNNMSAVEKERECNTIRAQYDEEINKIFQ